MAIINFNSISGVSTISVASSITVGNNVSIGTDRVTATTFSGNLNSTSGATTVAAGSTSAPSISPTGDSNTGIFFPSADTIAFAEGGVEALRITSTAQLQATGASDVRLTLGSSGTAGTNDSNHIRGDGTSLKFMNASGGVTIFENNGTERFRITNNGVTFNGDTVAANALDDYEEGTWTPTWAFGTSGSVSYQSQVGTYTKIGRCVYITCRIAVNTTSSPSGQAFLRGLPFVPATVSTQRVYGVSVSRAGSWTTAPIGGVFFETNSGELEIYKASSTANNTTDLLGSDFATNSFCSFFGYYEVS
jgi:hypothetical protein